LLVRIACGCRDYRATYSFSTLMKAKRPRKQPISDRQLKEVVLRDAIADESGNPTKLICNINGETVAQAMIVCGTDAMGLENPNWQENLILALKIQKNLEERYPGFMRPLNIRKERFNMHKTKGSLLFEIGTHGNTMEEAVRSAKYLAEGIAKTIN